MASKIGVHIVQLSVHCWPKKSIYWKLGDCKPRPLVGPPCKIPRLSKMNILILTTLACFGATFTFARSVDVEDARLVEFIRILDQGTNSIEKKIINRVLARITIQSLL